MLLYIMLYIVLACLMLFAALTNAVCLNNASLFSFFFLSLICANAFYFHALSLFILFFFICIMHSAFNLFVYLIICSHHCCFWCGFFLFFLI